MPVVRLAPARPISENTHARNPTRDSRNGVAHSKTPSQIVRLHQRIMYIRPVSKRLCIIFMACSCLILGLGRLKKKKKKRKKKKKEKIAVFPFSVYNSYFRQFVSVIGYIVTRTRWSDTYIKRLKSSRLGRVQAFPMYGGLGMSAPSLHRESTDSLIICSGHILEDFSKIAKFSIIHGYGSRLLVFWSQGFTHLCIYKVQTLSTSCSHFFLLGYQYATYCGQSHHHVSQFLFIMIVLKFTNKIHRTKKSHSFDE